MGDDFDTHISAFQLMDFAEICGLSAIPGQISQKARSEAISTKDLHSLRFETFTGCGLQAGRELLVVCRVLCYGQTPTVGSRLRSNYPNVCAVCILKTPAG